MVRIQIKRRARKGRKSRYARNIRIHIIRIHRCMHIRRAAALRGIPLLDGIPAAAAARKRTVRHLFAARVLILFAVTCCDLHDNVRIRLIIRGRARLDFRFGQGHGRLRRQCGQRLGLGLRKLRRRCEIHRFGCRLAEHLRCKRGGKHCKHQRKREHARNTKCVQDPLPIQFLKPSKQIVAPFLSFQRYINTDRPKKQTTNFGGLTAHSGGSPPRPRFRY